MTCADNRGPQLCCAEPSPPWNKVLGIAPRVQPHCSGGGKGWCEQQIPQPAKATGRAVQGWAAIHPVQKNTPPRYATSFPKRPTSRREQDVRQRFMEFRESRGVGAMVVPLFDRHGFGAADTVRVAIVGVVL